MTDAKTARLREVENLLAIFARNTQGHLTHTLTCAGWDGHRCSCLAKDLIEMRDAALAAHEALAAAEAEE